MLLMFHKNVPQRAECSTLTKIKLLGFLFFG
jgi:hypothetical protein